jgi:hypothetical protein
MPWTPSDAKRHNKKAIGKKARQWSDVANSVLKRTGDDGLAVREANGVIRKKSGGFYRPMKSMPYKSRSLFGIRRCRRGCTRGQRIVHVFRRVTLYLSIFVTYPQLANAITLKSFSVQASNYRYLKSLIVRDQEVARLIAAKTFSITQTLLLQSSPCSPQRVEHQRERRFRENSCTSCSHYAQILCTAWNLMNSGPPVLCRICDLCTETCRPA